jgi:hypothetical protein
VPRVTFASPTNQAKQIHALAKKRKDFSSVLAGCGGEWDEQVGFPESLLVSFGFFPSVSDPDEISLLLLPGAAVS